MKHLALIAAAGSMAAFAAPAQAAELPAAPAPIFASFNEGAAPFTSVAAFDDDDDWRDRRDRRRYRDRDRDWDDRRHEGRRGDYWRDNDGRWRCRRSDGTTGLLVGAGVGALLGRTVDTRGDRTVGTLLGAIGGGLLGREIDRGGARCR
jgi:Glycine zipper 2TM domain